MMPFWVELSSEELIQAVGVLGMAFSFFFLRFVASAGRA